MLEANEEYIALVSKYLTPKQLVWWEKQDFSDWNAFYCFLEKQAKEACHIQVLQNTVLGCKTLAVKRKCLHCGRDHNSKHCKLNCQSKVDRPKGKLQLVFGSSNKGVFKRLFLTPESSPVPSSHREARANKVRSLMRQRRTLGSVKLVRAPHTRLSNSGS